jgi:N6-adenosine-specific RNA methylase IME4
MLEIVQNFQTVLLDPPWPEQGGGKVKRGADRHYPLVKIKDMEAVIRSCEMWEDIGPNAHIYMWVTNNYLKDGLAIMEKLGFRYVTNLVWAKDRFGLGYYFRGQHEICLFGVRGKLPPCVRNQSTLIGQAKIKRGKHSKKPVELYDIIESVSPGPYLEIFARGKHPRGWISWGNEAGES